MDDAGNRPDSILVADALKGGPHEELAYELADMLANSLPSTAVAHAHLVAELAGYRSVIAAGREATEAGYRRDPEAVSAAARLIAEALQRPTDLFRQWTMAELLAAPSEFKWLIRGLLPDPTYGTVAGEMKSLKSYLTMFVTVGLAAGIPIFDTFEPVDQRLVVAFVGEGGREEYTRRLRRVCRAMAVNPADLDLRVTFDVAPIASPRFQASLHRALEDEPGLATLDALYSYHGPRPRRQTSTRKAHCSTSSPGHAWKRGPARSSSITSTSRGLARR